MATEQDLNQSYNERIKQLMLMVAGAQDSIRGENAGLQGRLGQQGADLQAQSAGVGNNILQLLQQTRARQTQDVNPLLGDLQRHGIRADEFNATNAGQQGYFDEQYARQGALQGRLAQIGQEDIAGRKMSGDTLATGSINDLTARGTQMGAGIEQERAQALAQLREQLAAAAAAGGGGGGGRGGSGGGSGSAVRKAGAYNPAPTRQPTAQESAFYSGIPQQNRGIPTLSTIGLAGTRQSLKRPDPFKKNRRLV